MTSKFTHVFVNKLLLACIHLFYSDKWKHISEGSLPVIKVVAVFKVPKTILGLYLTIVKMVPALILNRIESKLKSHIQSDLLK